MSTNAFQHSSQLKIVFVTLTWRSRVKSSRPFSIRVSHSRPWVVSVNSIGGIIQKGLHAQDHHPAKIISRRRVNGGKYLFKTLNTSASGEAHNSPQMRLKTSTRRCSVS